MNIKEKFDSILSVIADHLGYPRPSKEDKIQTKLETMRPILEEIGIDINPSNASGYSSMASPTLQSALNSQRTSMVGVNASQLSSNSVYAPYIPVLTTPVVNGNKRRYATSSINPNYYSNLFSSSNSNIPNSYLSPIIDYGTYAYKSELDSVKWNWDSFPWKSIYESTNKLSGESQFSNCVIAIFNTEDHRLTIQKYLNRLSNFKLMMFCLHHEQKILFSEMLPLFYTHDFTIKIHSGNNFRFHLLNIPSMEKIDMKIFTDVDIISKGLLEFTRLPRHDEFLTLNEYFKTITEIYKEKMNDTFRIIYDNI